MQSGQAGFTLIELLVVLVIIGALTGLAVLSGGQGSASRDLRNEAERLAAVIGVLADEAMLDGREYGLLIDSEGYVVLSYDGSGGTWVEAVSHRAQRIPASMRLLLELDGEALKLPDPPADREAQINSDKADRKEPLVPQVLILSSGELSAFRLRLEERRADGNAYALVSDGYQLPSAEPDDSP